MRIRPSWFHALVLVWPMSASAAFTYFDPTDTAQVPKRLSQTGLYSNINAKVLDTAAKYFTVNAPLWSDAAAKKRWVILRPGKRIPYVDTADFFDYPDSTVFVKTFLHVRPPNDSVYWETRLLVHTPNPDAQYDWIGFSYKWNAAETDADLVSIGNGFDTVFRYTENGRQTYRKWRFPSGSNCNQCHATQVVDPGNGILVRDRSVLGFFPSQLKGPSPLASGTNQVIDLFHKGVFSGPQPNAAALARRWRGMHEPIPPGLDAQARFKIIDTMARSYIAANCSGCHGYRGITTRTAGHALMSFDYHRLQPQTELAKHPAKPVDLHDTSESLRAEFLENVGIAGLASDPNWDMALPRFQDPSEITVTEVFPGYPAVSALLYRQLQRTPAAMDSIRNQRHYRNCAEWEDSVCIDRLSWLFTQPWGSDAWFNMLAAKGLSVDSLNDFYGGTRFQMPPIATYLPDEGALRILGEWVKTYRSDSVSGIRGAKPQAWGGALIRNRTLIVPKEWTGAAQMLDIQGRTYKLRQIGPGQFALPPQARPGIFFFRMGTQHFKAALL